MNAPKAIAISCQGISKSFPLIDSGNAWRLILGGHGIPEYKALKTISIEIPKGEFTGILGRNGAGKSTLLRVIGGVYTSETGKVKLDGILSGLYELGIAGNRELTGREYAERLLTIQGVGTGERHALLADILEFSELKERFDDPIVTYSAGMSARLFFSTATAGYYEIYLLDEILAVGDQHFRSKCWRRLRERVSHGASGVLVTHDWASVVKLCKIAHVLKEGEIIFSGPAEKAARHYLYGESAREEFQSGFAYFCDKPSYMQDPGAGSDFRMKAEIEIVTQAEVGVVFVIESMDPGYGWETALMSRDVTPVGNQPGKYEIEIVVPNLPLAPGNYQISLHLVAQDPDAPGHRIALDGYSWLNGDGLEIEIPGKKENGLTMSATWKVSTS